MWEELVELRVNRLSKDRELALDLLPRLPLMEPKPSVDLKSEVMEEAT